MNIENYPLKNQADGQPTICRPKSHPMLIFQQCPSILHTRMIMTMTMMCLRVENSSSSSSSSATSIIKINSFSSTFPHLILFLYHFTVTYTYMHIYNIYSRRDTKKISSCNCCIILKCTINAISINPRNPGYCVFLY